MAANATHSRRGHALKRVARVISLSYINAYLLILCDIAVGFQNGLIALRDQLLKTRNVFYRQVLLDASDR